MASELRNRKGNVEDKDAEIERLKAELAKAQTASTEVAQLAVESDDPKDRAAMIQEIQERLMQSVKKDVKPGLTNEAKKAKDMLQKDPFNLAFIFELGRCYAIDEQWDRSVNVLSRGWKRVHELAEPEARFDFLCVLCQGCMKILKYKQALAVFNDLEEPEDAQALRGFLVMSCQVHSYNGDMARCLKAFNRAIKDNGDFDDVLGIWVSCMSGLKKVGAFDAARSSIDLMVKSDEQRSKLETFQKLAEIKLELEEVVKDSPMSRERKICFGAILIIFLILIFVALYHFEAWSLSNMKLGNGK